MIGSRLEPLVDRFLIEETRGSVRLVLGTPVERELVFVHDRPWEGNRSGLATIIRDGAVCRMYYCGSQLDLHDGGYRIPHNYTCYAESSDGLAWTRPHLGLVDLPDREPNNAILTGQPPLTFTPFLDTNPDCAPDQRFKALALKYDPPPRALYGFASADGIHWSQIGERPLITTGYFDSQNIAFWDATRDEYRAYVRRLPRHPRRGRPRGRRARRAHLHIARLPGVDGAAVAVVRTGTVRGDLHQPDQPLLPGAAPVRRPAHALRHPATAVTELNERISRAQERFGTSYTDTALMTSRDGSAFDLWGEAFIRPGPVAKGRWHYGANGTALGMLETPGDGGTTELSLFVDEGGWDHPSRLRRYALRVDGFASLRAGAAGGEVLTRPLIFDGTRLVLNVSTSALGWLRVEVRTGRAARSTGSRRMTASRCSATTSSTKCAGRAPRTWAAWPARRSGCASPCATPTCTHCGFATEEPGDRGHAHRARREGGAVRLRRPSIPWRYRLRLEMHRPEKYDGNPVIARGPSGAADERRTENSPVIHDGERFRMWYIARDDGAGETAPGERER